MITTARARARAALPATPARPVLPSAPPPPFFTGDGYVQTWGADVAFQLGDTYLGVEHAFLSMIRLRDTIPSRALGGLADLAVLEAAVLEAAVLEAKCASAGGPPEAAMFLPEGQAFSGDDLR